MVDSVTYIKERHPEIYKNMKYKIVEISASLAKSQRKRAKQEGLSDVVEVINEDFFKWSGVQDSGEGSTESPVSNLTDRIIWPMI
jgi:SAM-dependent MidA family methyltransferase